MQLSLIVLCVYCSVCSVLFDQLHRLTSGDSVCMCSVYATMPGNGVRPTSEIMYTVTKACKAAGRADLAHAYAREFQANGLFIRPGLAALLEMDSSQVQAPTANAANIST